MLTFAAIKKQSYYRTSNIFEKPQKGKIWLLKMKCRAVLPLTAPHRAPITTTTITIVRAVPARAAVVVGSTMRTIPTVSSVRVCVPSSVGSLLRNGFSSLWR